MAKAGRATHIISLEAFMRRNPTDQEIATYHGCLAALRRLGWVEADGLAIIERPNKLLGNNRS